MTDPLRPPETDEEPWAIPEPVRRHLARDVALAAFAGMAILVLLAYVAQR